MDGVAYLNISMKHADNLVVSLMSLKEHWDGPVCIWAGDEDGKKVANACADDGRLGRIKVVEFDYKRITAMTDVSKGNIYFCKAYCMTHMSPFDRTVFLDADTQVAGDFSDIFPDEEEMRITQFAEWTTNTKMMPGRIEQWRDVAPTEVVRAFAGDYPAINTGVVSFSKTSTRFLQAWLEMTARKVQFIADEIAMQLIYPEYPQTVMDCRWNCSPRHCWPLQGVPGTYEGRHLECAEDRGLEVNGRDRLKVPDVRIWHHHGQKAVKEPRSRFMWMPYYDRARADNIANIREFGPAGKNGRLCKYLKDRTCHGPDFIPDVQPSSCANCHTVDEIDGSVLNDVRQGL